MLWPTGMLFPESVLQSPFISVLAAFVAVNTVIYATLAIAKLLPSVHLGELFSSRRRRSETRSIFPGSVRPDGAREPRRAHVAVGARHAQLNQTQRGEPRPHSHAVYKE